MKFQKVKLGDCCKFVRNGISVKQDKTSSGIPITRIETIANGTIDFARFGYAGILNSDEYVGYLMEGGDILMSHINSEDHLGKTAVYSGTPKLLIHGMNLLCLRPKQDLILPKFLLYFTKSQAFKEQLPRITNKSVNQASFAASRLKEKIQINVPVLEDQKRIVRALDAADALRQKRNQAIALLDDYSRAVFLEMFGDPVMNPKGWKVINLAHIILEVRNGITRRRKEMQNLGDVVLRLRDIRSNVVDFSDVNRIALNNSEKSKYVVEVGDLLFIRVNGNPDYVGRSAVFGGYTEPVYFNDHIMRVKIDKLLMHPGFLCYFLNTEFGKRQISLYKKTSAGQHTINQDGLSDIKIYFPAIELQNKFIENVSKTKTLSQIMFAQSVKLEANFNTLMQESFDRNF